MAWLHEPPGGTVLTDWGLHSMNTGGWLDEWYGASKQTIVSNQNGIESAPYALQNHYPVGHEGGTGTGNTNWFASRNGIAAFKQMYIGFTFKCSNPWDMNEEQGCKFGYIVENPRTTSGAFYMTWFGSSTHWGHMTGQADISVDNTHIPPNVFLGTWNMYNNVGSVSWQNEQWVRVEMLVRQSSTPTSRDGWCDWWFNGTPCGSYHNINTMRSKFDGFMIAPIWGSYGRGKLWTDYSWYDHVRIVGYEGGTDPIHAVASLSPAAPHLVVNTSLAMTVGLNRTANGNQVVSLTSSDGGKVSVPDSVTVLNGQSAASFSVHGNAVGTSTVSALLNGSVSQVVTVDEEPIVGGDTYSYVDQFSGVQGQDGWSYLEEDGTPMTYAPGLWSGRQTYQYLWQGGGCPGPAVAGGKSRLRWQAPKAGAIHITGNVRDTQIDMAGGDGVTLEIFHNGDLLDTYTVVEGNGAGLDFDLSRTVVINDTIDFLLGPRAWNPYDGTGLTPVITYAETAQTHHVALAASVTGFGVLSQARQAILMALQAVSSPVATLGRGLVMRRALQVVNRAVVTHSRAFLQNVTVSIHLAAQAVGTVTQALMIPLRAVGQIAARWLLLFGGHG